jgi:hypothetical protein
METLQITRLINSSTHMQCFMDKSHLKQITKPARRTVLLNVDKTKSVKANHSIPLKEIYYVITEEIPQ